MKYDIIVIGAGASGMICAAEAATTGARVLLVDHAKAPGEKIRISGGGRCNFTNIHTSPENFLSRNPHFCKSALAQYSHWDFIELVDRYQIPWHEKTLGQLFCDNSAKDIIEMLRTEMGRADVDLWLQTSVKRVDHDDDFTLTLTDGRILRCKKLVIATGGKSIPKMGATGFAHDIARQFGLGLIDTRPALVPLTFSDKRFAPITGISIEARVSNDRTRFEEALLCTHRGLSGPAILQISSYWREGEAITVNLLPKGGLADALKTRKTQHGRRALTTELAEHLPARLVNFLASEFDFKGNLADLSNRKLDALEAALQNWALVPNGSEGYRTAEVTLGGIDTDDLDSKTMQAKDVEGLYFIGECVDVTGWLGGYNFQWAWSSGVAAGRALAG